MSQYQSSQIDGYTTGGSVHIPLGVASYGMEKVCKVWEIAYLRHQKHDNSSLKNTDALDI